MKESDCAEERCRPWASEASILGLALVVRLCMVFVGGYLDSVSHVQYTDLDYWVFTDAAKHVSEGRSPFERPSYRYSPLLAWVLTGNIHIHPSFGKVLFSLFDVFCIKETFLLHSMFHPQCQQERRWLLWLLCFNPISIAICTRGSCDALSNYLVLLTLRLASTRTGSLWQTILASLSYATVVHARLYPIIYLPALLLAFIPKLPVALSDLRQWRIDELAHAALFGGCAVAGVVTLAWLSGEDYVQHALLHHLVRADHRHNFSAYFLDIFLQKSANMDGAVIGSLLPFCLQATLLLVIAWRYAQAQLALCLLLQTMVFVAWNKVITAQYFLWYLCLLPIALNKKQLLSRELLVAAAGWGVAVCYWLWRAFQLEILGLPVLHAVWRASLLFLAAHTMLIMAVAYSARSAGGGVLWQVNALSLSSVRE